MVEYSAYTLAERRDLLDEVEQFAGHWAKFMNHDAIAGQHFGRLYEWFPDYQVILHHPERGVIARALSVPICWDGSDAGLSNNGWDWALLNAVETYEAGLKPNAVSAIEINILPELRGQGLSKAALTEMKAAARARGFTQLVAPVRPNLKSRYPLTPMENYTRWTNGTEGAPFDPWLRVHWRDGARIVRVAPQSMKITGTIAEWETWTGMRFPETGAYIVPEALVPVEIDCEADQGCYIEPNVWMVHPV